MHCLFQSHYNIQPHSSPIFKAGKRLSVIGSVLRVKKDRVSASLGQQTDKQTPGHSAKIENIDCD